MTSDDNIFNGRPIRAEYDNKNEEWLFSAVDIVAVLAEPANPRKYWNDTKRRLKEDQLSAKIGQLKLSSADGKSYKTDVLNAKDITLIARRIRSAHTEAFIEWLNDFTGTSRRFVLKHKDVDVVELELDGHGAISVLGKTLNEMHLPVGTIGDNGADRSALYDWWKDRSIPASREGLRDILDSLGMIAPQQLLDKSFGLSLSDQYWICPRGKTLKWKNVNFFHNDFSEDVGDLLFKMMKFTGRKAISLVSPDNTSDGILKKKWKIIDNKRCLIKGGSKPFNQEVANEVLASRVCERLGIPHINYGIMEIDGKKYCACEDFVTGDTELVTAWRVMNLIKKKNHISDHESFIAKVEEFGIQDVRKRIDMMLVLDFIIVNTDRHYNNFGLIRDANTLEWISVAPIYDSGTSMWCKDIPNEMDARNIKIESKPFRSTHDKQIELVSDLSWLDISALDGIEEEYAEMLSMSVADPSVFDTRNKALCSALKERIRMLKAIVNKKQN